MASDLIEVAGDVCTFDSRPSIASDGSNIVVGWSDSDEGFLAWVNTSGEVSATASLGEDARHPGAHRHR